MTTTGLYFHPYPRTGLDFSNSNLDRVLKTFFGSQNLTDNYFSKTENSMLVKTDLGYELTMLVPGFSKEDITVSVEGRHLTIEGKLLVFEQQKKMYNNIGVENFKKTVALTSDINVNDLTANMSNGILTVNIPNPRASQKHTIPIE
jgi:HSP20 family protein